MARNVPEWQRPRSVEYVSGRNSHRGMWLTFGIAVVLAAGLAAWSLWPRHTAAPQARQYLNATACLLTGKAGIAPDTPAAQEWASMEAASVTTHVMVSYLPGTGPADVPVMLNTLILRECGVIITADAAPAQVLNAAQAHPQQHFLLVTALSVDVPRVPRNTIVVAPAGAPKQINEAIHALAVAG